MSGAVEVAADPERQAGHAVIRIHGAGQFAGSTKFRIRRDDYDEGVFGPSGWQVADHLLTPDDKSVDGNDLLLRVGPSIVQRMHSGVYHFTLPAAQMETTIFWPDVPLEAGGTLNIVAEPLRVERRAAMPARPTIVRKVSTEPAPSGEPDGRMSQALADDQAQRVAAAETDRDSSRQPEVAAEKKSKRRLWLVPLLIVLLLLGAAGGYFGYHRFYLPQPPQPVAEQEATSPPHPAPSPHPTPPASPPAGPSLESMSAMDAIRSGASAEALFHEAQRRLQLGGPQVNDALLLLREAAERDYVPAHTALAQLYDPNSHRTDIAPDLRQSALHYLAAVRGGDNSVAASRAALKALLEQQAGHNDLYAPVVLKEFWQ